MISGFKASMNNLWEIGAHSAYFLTRLGNWVYALVELPICEATDGSDSSRGSASILQLTVPDSFRHPGIEVGPSSQQFHRVQPSPVPQHPVILEVTQWRSLST